MKLYKSLICVVIGLLLAGCATTPVEGEHEKPEVIKIRGYYTITFPHPEEETEWDIEARQRRLFEARETDGFRGIKFGTDISTLEDMVFVGKRIIKEPYWVTDVYARKNEETWSWLSDEPVNIKYFFSEGKFCYVEIITHNSKSYEPLENAFCKQFGAPVVRDYYTNAPTWIGEKTIVDIKRVDKTDTIPMLFTGITTWWEKRVPINHLGIGVLYPPSYRLSTPPSTIMRIMTKESAEHLHYQVKIKEKKKGEF